MSYQLEAPVQLLALAIAVLKLHSPSSFSSGNRFEMASNYLTVVIATILLLIQSISGAPAPAPVLGIVASLQPSIPVSNLPDLIVARPTPSFPVSNIQELRPTQSVQTVLPSIPASFAGQQGFAGFQHKPVPETRVVTCLPTPTWSCAPV